MIDADAPAPLAIKRPLFIVVVRALYLFVGLTIAPRLLLAEGTNLFSATGSALLLVLVVISGDVLLALLLLAKVAGHTPRSLGWSSSQRVRDVALGVAGFLACASILGGVVAALGGRPALDEMADSIVAFTVSQRLLFMVIGVFGAALVEESLYRGSLQTALVSRFGPARGVLLTSFLFGVLHLQPNPVGLLIKAAFGVVFGALALRTRALWAPAVAHALVWAVIGAA